MHWYVADEYVLGVYLDPGHVLESYVVFWYVVGGHFIDVRIVGTGIPWPTKALISIVGFYTAMVVVRISEHTRTKLGIPASSRTL